MSSISAVRVLTLCLIGLTLLFSSPSTASAAPQFTINPSSGFVLEGNQFTIDILIDTAGENVIKAKSVITFDPTLVQIVKAERNNTLFQQYPTDEQSTDNTNGVLMLTGFTQSGSGTPYKTSGSADVYARVTFKANLDGQVVFDWEYTGQDAPFKTVIMKDGSPPQNILTSKPVTAKFTIQDIDGTVGPNPNPQPQPQPGIPNTGILTQRGFYPVYLAMGGGILLYIGVGVYSRYTKMSKYRKYRTIVDYEE